MRLNGDVVRHISSIKNEPEWMLKFRLNALEAFDRSSNPSFGPKLDIDYDSINYYKEREEELTDNWDNLSCGVKNLFDDFSGYIFCDII